MNNKKRTTATAGKINIEALLAKKENIGAEALRNALTKHEQKLQQEKEEELLKHLGTVHDHVNTAVDLLRNARKEERAAKAYLEDIAKAQQQFYNDADFSKYLKARAEALKKHSASKYS